MVLLVGERAEFDYIHRLKLVNSGGYWWHSVEELVVAKKSARKDVVVVVKITVAVFHWQVDADALS